MTEEATLLERAVVSLRNGVDSQDVASALEVRLARYVSVATCTCGHDRERHRDAAIAPECLDCLFARTDAMTADDFGGDEELVCTCGHRVRRHDAWGCVDCDCPYFPSRAISVARAASEDQP